MLRKISAMLLIVALLFVIGCAAHTHQIGKGAQGNDIDTERQWYILWGIVPINEVDTNAMSDGATDYNIITAYTPVDFAITAVAQIITVSCRTVIVEK